MLEKESVGSIFCVYTNIYRVHGHVVFDVIMCFMTNKKQKAHDIFCEKHDVPRTFSGVPRTFAVISDNYSLTSSPFTAYNGIRFLSIRIQTFYVNVLVTRMSTFSMQYIKGLINPAFQSFTTH